MAPDKIKGKSGKPGQNYRKPMVMEGLLYDFFQMQYLLLTVTGDWCARLSGILSMNFNLWSSCRSSPKRLCWNYFLVGCSYREDQYNGITSGVANNGRPGIASRLSLLLCLFLDLAYFFKYVWGLGCSAWLELLGGVQLQMILLHRENIRVIVLFLVLTQSSALPGAFSTFILSVMFPTHVHNIYKGSDSQKQPPLQRIWHK